MPEKSSPQGRESEGPPRGRHTPVSVFRRRPKIDDAVLIRLVYGFCQGVHIDAVAASLGLSHKTVRAACLDLRARLKKTAFRRWHGHTHGLVKRVPSEVDGVIRTAFIDVLAACHGNHTCYMVFRRGNRKTRLCRACPLPVWPPAPQPPRRPR